MFLPRILSICNFFRYFFYKKNHISFLDKEEKFYLLYIQEEPRNLTKNRSWNSTTVRYFASRFFDVITSLRFACLWPYVNNLAFFPWTYYEKFKIPWVFRTEGYSSKVNCIFSIFYAFCIEFDHSCFCLLPNC